MKSGTSLNGESSGKHPRSVSSRPGGALLLTSTECFPTPILGPCTASQPSVYNKWYQKFYSFILSNGSVPTYYCWHEETPGDDVATDIENNIAAVEAYHLPQHPAIINEYGMYDEQAPGASAWFISRLERYNTSGLRGNWASAYSLHDYFANLLGKPGATEDCTDHASCAVTTGYWGNGEYEVYRYLNMTGQRMQTVGAPDNLFDVYATMNPKSVNMVCGSRLTAGTWDILVTNMSAAGLPPSGYVIVQSYRFDFDGIFGKEVPVNQGTSPYYYSDDRLVFSVSPNTTMAYAFEFVAENSYTTTPPRGCSQARAVAVTFDKHVATDFGQTIKIVGDIDTLGNWDVADAVPLSASEYTSSDPLWTVEISLPVVQVIQYKYIKVQPDGTVEWEADPTHIYTVPASCATMATESSTWQT